MIGVISGDVCLTTQINEQFGYIFFFCIASKWPFFESSVNFRELLPAYVEANPRFEALSDS